MMLQFVLGCLIIIVIMKLNMDFNVVLFDVLVKINLVCLQLFKEVEDLIVIMLTGLIIVVLYIGFISNELVFS